MHTGLFHIAFAINDTYVPYITVTIKSIIENNRGNELCIHVLTDSISNSNRKRLGEVVSDCKNMKLNIYLVNDDSLHSLKTGVWPIHAWYRILLPYVLPDTVNRVLYLDADTLVLASLNELFAIDMENCSIAAVLDPMSLKEDTFVRCGYFFEKLYVCSGVMMMNLHYWRKYKLTEKIIEWGRIHVDEIEYPDQDVINHVCQDSKTILPFRFGILNCFQYDDFYKPPYFEALKECIEKPVIVHYANSYPWLKDWNKHPFCIDWIKYNKKLRHPVRRTYKNKGWLGFKIWLWDFFHPRAVKGLTKEEVVLKIKQIEKESR